MVPAVRTQVALDLYAQFLLNFWPKVSRQEVKGLFVLGATLDGKYRPLTIRL